MTDIYVAAAVAVCSLVTVVLRFLPFIIFRGDRETPEFITYLGKKLPYAVMAMLVVYCLKSIDFVSSSEFLPEIIASAVTVVSYIFKRNTLLSIILGTAIYMILVQFVFI